MIRVTWEWLGQGDALDLANTVTITDGAEHDLLGSVADYERWARAEAAFLPAGPAEMLPKARVELLELRTAIREVVAAVSSSGTPPTRAVKELNRVSRTAPRWVEYDPGSQTLTERTSASRLDDLLARYSRSALQLAADPSSDVTRCPAPSCGMFYPRSRAGQRWCSPQCGTRARVARHYENHRARRASRP